MTSAIMQVVQKLDDLYKGKKENFGPQAWASAIHNPNTDRSLATTRHEIGVNGTLTSMVPIIESGVPTRNVYLRACVEDERQVERAQLFRGYCDPRSKPSGNGSLPVRSDWNIRLESMSSMGTAPDITLSGSILTGRTLPGAWTGTDESNMAPPGNYRWITGTDPAAMLTGNTGGVTTETVPTNGVWRVHTWHQQLVCSATVATRTFQLDYDDGNGTADWSLAVGDTIVASETEDYYFAISMIDLTTARLTDLMTPLPAVAYLIQAHEITTTNDTGRMADNMGPPHYRIEEWLQE